MENIHILDLIKFLYKSWLNIDGIIALDRGCLKSI